MFDRSVPQITVEELARRLSDPSRSKLQLIDVRERQELEIASLQGFINLPLSEFAQWSEKIHSNFDPEVETLVICHHGIRSAQMCQWLTHQGFTKVKNIAGGIEAYSLAIDPSLPRY
jgi:rhodanese-related sulfurtransferase